MYIYIYIKLVCVYIEHHRTCVWQEPRSPFPDSGSSHLSPENVQNQHFNVESLYCENLASYSRSHLSPKNIEHPKIYIYIYMGIYIYIYQKISCKFEICATHRNMVQPRLCDLAFLWLGTQDSLFPAQQKPNVCACIYSVMERKNMPVTLPMMGYAQRFIVKENCVH